MATNKHAIIRYQTLDKCFRNIGRKYYMEDLVDACSEAIYDYTGSDAGIKARQVFEDIKFMQSEQGWNIPLDKIRDGHQVYYRYEDTKFSINNQPLNEMEANQMKEALLTLSRFKGMPQFEWMDEIIARIDSGLGLSRAAHKIIGFDHNNYLKGLEYITPLYNAILYQKTICISYQSFKQTSAQPIYLHPYFLKQYNNRWFVFGRNDATGFIINLALDRIDAVADSKIDFIANDAIDFDEYFDDIVGVSINADNKIEKIVLKVSNELYPYIATKPIHGSQKVKSHEESHTLIGLDLIPNYELESLLLSYGDGIEVMEPAALRDRMIEKIQNMKNNYNIADRMHNSGGTL